MVGVWLHVALCDDLVSESLLLAGVIKCSWVIVLRTDNRIIDLILEADLDEFISPLCDLIFLCHCQAKQKFQSFDVHLLLLL